MKKFAVLLILIFCGFLSTANATVIEMAPGTYEMPSANSIIASQPTIDLSHYSYYEWVIGDLDMTAFNNSDNTLNIVFHGIHDWTVEEDDTLNVYLRDGNSTETVGQWTSTWDSQSPNNPDWSAWTHVGTWSDDNGWNRYGDGGAATSGPTYDVVFSIALDNGLENILANDGTFVIGIDADCHYFGDKITVNAPVPEPATLLLLGVGIIGILGTRKKFKK